MSALTQALLAVCPSCKEGLAGADQWAQGFNTSILFMMVMPFAVVGVVAAAAVHARRRQRRHDDGAPPPAA